MEIQASRFYAGVFSDGVILLQNCLAFAYGYFVFIVAEVEQFAEPPDAGEIQGIGSVGPAFGEFAQSMGDFDFVPVILCIQ